MNNHMVITSHSRIYYIDLLRAIAIMLVVFAHSVSAFGSPPLLAPLELGGTGVDLFFILSGWLIGSQLYKEQKAFGTIDIKRFWIRRWFRTLPAYYAILAATLLQLYLTKDNVASPLPHLFFYQNYTVSSYFTISWSLALEEQFYLVIAPVVLFLKRLAKRTQLTILIAGLLLPSIFRYFEVYGTLEETHVRLDCCIMGVLLAFIYYNYANVWNRFVSYSSTIAFFSVIVYLSFYWTRYVPSFGTTENPSSLILALTFATLVFYAVNMPISKLPIAHNFIMHISTRSYSIYLVHVEALAISRNLVSDTNFIVFFTVTFILTLMMSEVLYRCVERVFMKVRDKFEFSKSKVFA